jgi:hypothetical protein
MLSLQSAQHLSTLVLKVCAFVHVNDIM